MGTRKYYSPQDFERHSITYKKIYVQGAKSGKTVPDDSNFLEFVQAVQQHGNKDSVIGVHCTHGLNRTGYMICRYMIEEIGYEPDDAIRLFNDARGHTMEREAYLSDLRNRSKRVTTLGASGFSNIELGAEAKQEPKTSLVSSTSKTKKQRWRHHRDSHPDWRPREHHQSHRQESCSSDMDHIQPWPRGLLPGDQDSWHHQQDPHSYQRSKEHDHGHNQESFSPDLNLGNKIMQPWPQEMPPKDQKDLQDKFHQAVSYSRDGCVGDNSSQIDFCTNRNQYQQNRNRFRERWHPSEFQHRDRGRRGRGRDRNTHQNVGLSSYQSAGWGNSSQNFIPSDDGYGQFGHRKY